MGAGSHPVAFYLPESLGGHFGHKSVLFISYIVWLPSVLFQCTHHPSTLGLWISGCSAGVLSLLKAISSPLFLCPEFIPYPFLNVGYEVSPNRISHWVPWWISPWPNLVASWDRGFNWTTLKSMPICSLPLCPSKYYNLKESKSMTN